MAQFWKKLLSGTIAVQMIMFGVLPVFAQEREIALKVMDTTAGQPALIMVSGQPHEIIDLTIENPFNATVIQKFELSEEGVLQYWYPRSLVAGEYVITAVGQTASFNVTAATPDPQKSKLELSDYTAFAGDKIDGQAVLKDAYGNPVGRRVIEIESKQSAQVACLNQCRSNDRGELFFTVQSKKAGLKQLTFADQESGVTLFQESIGFIPLVQRVPQPTFSASSPYFGYENYQQLAPYPFYQPTPVPESEFDFIPVFDPTRATEDSQGNNDQFFNSLIAQTSTSSTTPSTSTSSEGTTPTTSTTSTAALPVGPGFQIIFGSDPKAPFKEDVTVQAQSALDFFVKAVDSKGEVNKAYTGKIKFQIEPSSLLPPDYQFTALDQGVALFELALVLPEGKYKLTITDVDKPTLKGEVAITAQLKPIQNLNNTNIVLKIDSPVSKSKYSKTINVQGSTNTDNTEIIVKEGPVELKRVPVDQNKQYNFSLELSDGLHKLDITALYIVDGSQSTTTVEIEVDKTPPVITKVNADIDPVRAGQPFTITAEAEKDSTLKAFIANRAYDFVGDGTNYTLTGKAPLDAGDYPINLQISDELGNSETSPNVGVLKVLKGLENIKNLFGIPGIGTITLSWDPVEEADSYEVKYKSILGVSAETLTSETSRLTVENLAANVSYVFTVTAKDVAGTSISVSTDSRALKVLEAPVRPAAPVVEEAPVVTAPTELRPAAEVVTKPKKFAKSGPEVYVLVLLSIFLLHGYARIRRAFARRETS